MREFYTQIEDNRLVKIEVELEAEENIMDMAIYPWLYTVFIKLKTPLENGLANEDEEDFLFECKDRLALKLEEKEKAVYVGLKITDGWFEIYFYLEDPKGVENKTKDLLNAFGYKYESNSVKDKKWNLYEVTLYPTAKQAHHIQSRQIIEEMVEEGDDITKAREVEHYILFQTASLREKFEEVLEEKSLTCKGDFEREEEEYVHGVALSITQTLEEKSINETTDMLMDLCKEHHGHYEGWSTSLVDEQI
jgi:regulator of RNase E activity RraB